MFTAANKKCSCIADQPIYHVLHGIAQNNSECTFARVGHKISKCVCVVLWKLCDG